MVATWAADIQYDSYEYNYLINSQEVYSILLANFDVKFSSSLYVKVTILKVKGCNKEAAHSNTTRYLQVFSMVKENECLYFTL